MRCLCIFCLKDLTLAYVQAKTVLRTFSFSRRYSIAKLEFFFLPDCSFKICGNPSKIFESVRGVLSVSAQSLTTLTPCPHSQRLNRHCGHVVNNYFSTCQHSQWLRRHAIFENINYHLCYFFVSFFTFSKVKNFPCFCVVIDYADKMPT